MRATLLLALGLAACATTPVPGRLRFVSSIASGASWSFVIDDHARGAELLVDGRTRDDDCLHVRNTIRCELRGLWPGGHTVEVRLPGAVLRRSVLLGRAWPARPVFVRARFKDEARAAADAGADGVIVEGSDLQELVEAAHAGGARALVVGDPRPIETAGADGVVDGAGALPSTLAGRFPEARVFSGLIEAHDVPSAALALLDGRGVIVEPNAFALLRVRKKHAALAGGSARPLVTEPSRRAFELAGGGDHLELIVNLGSEEWRYSPAAVQNPLDLLGSHQAGGAVLVRPHDAAVVVRSPAPDLTRY